MAELDLGPLLKRAVSAHLEMFKEEIRVLRADAWNQGYAAADSGSSESTNPYLKENDTGGNDAGDSSPPA
jgi:hypothetical protein